MTGRSEHDGAWGLGLDCVHPVPADIGARMRYADHLAALRDRQRAHRDAAGPGGSAGVFAAYLAETLGVPLDRLTDDERRTVDWLAGWDADTVAGAATLLDTAADVAADLDDRAEPAIDDDDG